MKKVLFVLAPVLLCACSKKDPPPANPIDEIAGVYSGPDSSSFIHLIRPGSGPDHQVETNTSVGTKTIIVTKISDTEFNINLDSAYFGPSKNTLVYNGNSYIIGGGLSGQSRKILFFPDNDSISVTDDITLKDTQPEWSDGSVIPGELVYSYSKFGGKK
jgi:hypothetical protein